MPRVRALALEDLAGVDGRLTALATSGPVTRRLMTPPGADVIVAPPPRSAVEDPDRFPHSRDAGARAGEALARVGDAAGEPHLGGDRDPDQPPSPRARRATASG